MEALDIEGPPFSTKKSEGIKMSTAHATTYN